MMVPVPVLGYASKSEAAAALKDAGLSIKGIARLIDSHPDAISMLVRSGRGDRVRRRVQSEAAKRGLTATELRRALIAAIVDDDLFAAILDDERAAE